MYLEHGQDLEQGKIGTRQDLEQGKIWSRAILQASGIILEHLQLKHRYLAFSSALS